MKIPLADSLSLLHACDSIALATHSQAVPGYPFATVLPFALDSAHQPWVLMSELAEHCRNVRLDGRVSMLFNESTEETLTARRMTIVGDLYAQSPDALTRQRLLRYQPEFEDYLELGDFNFFRLQPRRVRYIGGFGQMGWQEADSWQWLPVLDGAVEEATLVILAAQYPEQRLLGVDCFGLDLQQHGRRLRLDFAEPVGSGNVLAAAQALLKM